MPVPAIYAGVAAVGAVASVFGGISARKSARRAGRASSRFILEETREKTRRQEIQNRNVMGSVRVSQGASNLQFQSGSQSQYASFLSGELDRRLSWTQRSGKLRAKAARRGANIAGDSAMSSGISSGIGYGLQAYSFSQNIAPKVP